jgi:hypothetical protein
MPGKKDNPLSRAKQGAVDFYPVMEETPPVETWTMPAGQMTGETVAAVETWTTPAREVSEDTVATMETWTMPARR